MKNCLILILCICFCQSIRAQDTLIGVSLKHLHHIEEAFKDSPELPRAFPKGSVLTIETDKVYLINDRRYTYYKKLEDLRDLIETDNQDSIVMALILHYETSLDSCKMYYTKLLDNAKKSNDLSQVFIAETKKIADGGIKTLSSANENLDKATQNLNQSLIHLTEAEKFMKKSLRLKWLDRIVIGAACLAIGFAVGSL